jgi:hypothetical protein
MFPKVEDAVIFLKDEGLKFIKVRDTVIFNVFSNEEPLTLILILTF